jgi:hypothetical protein
MTTSSIRIPPGFSAKQKLEKKKKKKSRFCSVASFDSVASSVQQVSGLSSCPHEYGIWTCHMCFLMSTSHSIVDNARCMSMFWTKSVSCPWDHNVRMLYLAAIVWDWIIFPQILSIFKQNLELFWRNVNFWFKLNNFYFFRQKKIPNIGYLKFGKEKKKKEEKGLKATYKEREMW